MFIGVDFGSKRAGTTAIAYHENGQIHVLQSIKGEDADKFIRNYLQALQADLLFIDAPLSIPKGLYEDNEEVFYRQADRQLQAMSPMFLGGLTSRAVLLKKQLQKKKVKTYEVYPKALVQELKLEKHYKKDLAAFMEALQEFCPPLPEVRNWHQADACLAWLSGFRFTNGEASSYGNEEEGMVYV
ncbi:MAG: DUF429 domain-containing protein [Bacteroidota bacterium]|nr:DUF429 domain-containing protein [Bacteroidota bacterium]MDX5430845.1 DUF429 domain-containing protein [Bacteroidota bacterium]MDX5469589.1 DUF429 domain-containing protein [Bacteroidota bacterium]